MSMLSFFKSHSNNQKKLFILFIYIISFVIIIDCYGICQIVQINISEETQQKGELKEKGSINILPFTQGMNSKVNAKTSASQDKLSQTVKGLKDAGYSLGEITTILKNDKNDAQTISIACFKEGYLSDQIYSALAKAGFDKNTINKVVPNNTRNLSNVLNVAETSTTVLEDGSKTVSAAEIIEVPVSVGVTFNGLGNWGEFQDKRFK